MSGSPTVELPDFEKWTPAGKERALDELNRSNLDRWKPFYCPRPFCDGNHHITVIEASPVCEDDRPHDWVAIGPQWVCVRCDAQGHADDAWTFRHGRADQHPPPPTVQWLIWLLLAGRGAGKTRAGSEWTHRLAEKFPGARMALISPTASDVRDTQVEGESGILATARPGMVPEWEPSKKRLTWPNGFMAFGYSGEEPDRLRGKQHSFAWCDEPAHIALIKEVWYNLMLGLRLGKDQGIDPRVCLTTSPLPTKWLKDTIKDPRTVMSRASTYANIANLPEHYRSTVLAQFEGTRLGRQEIEGLLLEDVEGALWTTAMIDDNRADHDQQVKRTPDEFGFERVLVAVDPAGTSRAKSDETGIVVGGQIEDTSYPFADYSGRYTPDEWAAKTLLAYDVHKADAIVVEITYGREMVIAVLQAHCDRDGRDLPRIIGVDSRRGKVIRAEPIVARYERGQVQHIGVLETLENQMTTWVVGQRSPDRLDALVHLVTELAHVSSPAAISTPYDVVKRRTEDEAIKQRILVLTGSAPAHSAARNLGMGRTIR